MNRRDARWLVARAMDSSPDQRAEAIISLVEAPDADTERILVELRARLGVELAVERLKDLSAERRERAGTTPTDSRSD